MPDRLALLRVASASQARLAAAVVVVLAAVIPYLPSLDNYFVQDDFGVVWLLSQKPWSTFPQWFTTTWMDDIWGYTPDEIRPFPALSYQIAAAFGAGAPAANHWINIAFHAANGLLALWIARAAAGLRLGAATLAAAIFVLLPIHPESVAWITGRVDSMPAFFYFASFVLFGLWRTWDKASVVSGQPSQGRHARLLYASSVACCFVALFTKQNTITLGPALVLFDLMTGRTPWAATGSVPRASAGRRIVAWAVPYLPFAILTAGYLLLRYVLFGQIAREETLTAQRLAAFGVDVSLHLRRLLFGEAGTALSGTAAAALVVAALAAIALVARGTGSADTGRLDARKADARKAGTARLGRAALFFGVAWMVLGVAPILVSGYYSPRHMYLASLGWAIVAAIGVQILWDGRPTRLLRPLAAVAAAALLIGYTVQLVGVVQEWDSRSAVSQRAVADLEREALAAPPGSLIVVGAPARSWEYALPHATNPPYTSTPLRPRVSIIYRAALHCCSIDQWDYYTRQTVRVWMAQPTRPPVIALYWDPQTGALSRVREQDEPYLRTLMSVLLDTSDRGALDGALARMFAELVAPRRVSP